MNVTEHPGLKQYARHDGITIIPVSSIFFANVIFTAGRGMNCRKEIIVTAEIINGCLMIDY